MRIPRLFWALPLLALLPFGCSSGPLDPTSGGIPQIRLQVTGGLAGADYTISLDGFSGVVRGESCINSCQFEAGDLLRILDPEQVDNVQGLFLSAGIHALNGTDFGNECCDQIHFDLAYRDDQGLGTVRGTSTEIPEALREALVTLMTFSGLPSSD